MNISEKKYLCCKKDYSKHDSKVILFHKGEKYYYYSDKYSDDDVFIYYNEKSEDEYKRGRRFYFSTDHIGVSFVYDYFCTPIEERKFKLEKINGSNL